MFLTGRTRASTHAITRFETSSLCEHVWVCLRIRPRSIQIHFARCESSEVLGVMGYECSRIDCIQSRMVTTTFRNVATMVVARPMRTQNICFRFFTVSYLVNSCTQVCIRLPPHTHERERKARTFQFLQHRESRQSPYTVCRYRGAYQLRVLWLLATSTRYSSRDNIILRSVRVWDSCNWAFINAFLCFT